MRTKVVLSTNMNTMKYAVGALSVCLSVCGNERIPNPESRMPKPFLIRPSFFLSNLAVQCTLLKVRAGIAVTTVMPMMTTAVRCTAQHSNRNVVCCVLCLSVCLCVRPPACCVACGVWRHANQPFAGCGLLAGGECNHHAPPPVRDVAFHCSAAGCAGSHCLHGWDGDLLWCTGEQSTTHPPPCGQPQFAARKRPVRAKFASVCNIVGQRAKGTNGRDCSGA